MVAPRRPGGNGRPAAGALACTAVTDPSVDALAAALRLEAQDLSLYAGFLLNTLSDALPPELVRVTRKGGLRRKLGGGEAPVTEIAITLGEQRFVLSRDSVGAPPRAAVSHAVGGIVLRTQTLGLAEWTRLLAQALLDRSGDSDAARAALERLLPPGSLG